MKTVTKFILTTLLATIITITLFGLYTLERYHDHETNHEQARLEACMRTFWQLMSDKGSDFRIAGNKLMTGNYVVNGNSELPDRIQEIFGGVATVFMGDERVSTNVLTADGKRAVGTKLVGPAFDAVFKLNKPYRGTANILGVPYMTAYDPITDKNGRTIGVLFVGIKESDLRERLHEMKSQITLTLFAMLSVLTFLMVLGGIAIKRIDDEKEKQINFQKTLMDTIPNPIFYKGCDGHYMGCNKAFEEYVGLTQQELLGRRPHDLWPAELADNYLQQDLAMFSNPGMQSYETSVRHADGAVRDVIFNKATFAEKDGSVAGLVCVIQDITEYKRTEDEKLRLESQLAYARLMETIMIRLGHDLKTPLTPLFILLPLLKKQLADPEQIKKIETCIKSAASIKSLADKTGILARLSYGSEGQHKTFFPLASLVDQAIKDCSQQISYKQICCQNLIDPALKLHGVQGQFNELFNNLISNAAVFSNEHGSITISALCDTSKVLISVRDKGIGIAPDHLDDVFDEFFKADESRHNLGASGLGLSICKRIVQNHHGRIWAESPGPGQGTTINIRINNDASDHRPTGKESAQ